MLFYNEDSIKLVLMTKAGKIFLIFALISFVLNTFGFIFLFVGAKEILRMKTWKEVNEMESSKEMEVISIPAADFETGNGFQRVNKKEIRFRGKMYDVVKEERYNDKLIFYCIHDEKEDKLDKEFSNEVRKNLDSKSATSSTTNLIHLIQYAEIGKNQNISPPVRKNNYLNFYITRRSQIDPQVLTPPPKLIFV